MSPTDFAPLIHAIRLLPYLGAAVVLCVTSILIARERYLAVFEENCR